MTSLFPITTMPNPTSLPDPRTTSFVMGYWRPWNEGADIVTSYLDYTKDTSLAKYGADTVGQYISQASREHVQAIENLSRQLSSQLSSIDASLLFLNHNMELAVEQQRLSNLLLEDIKELLRVPDSEKERQHTIELGIKFFVNAGKDPDLYADALETLLKAETMMKQDYFVLHRIGCIYLHVEKCLDPAKALDYFTRAAKYASAEMDPKAARLANVLTAGRNTANALASESPDAIRSLAAASYEEAAFAAYVIGRNEEAVRRQSQLLQLCPTARVRFLLSKYMMRNGQKAEALHNLDQAIADAPLLLAATFREVDLVNEPGVLAVIEQHSATYRRVIALLESRANIVQPQLEKLLLVLQAGVSDSSDKLVQRMVAAHGSGVLPHSAVLWESVQREEEVVEKLKKEIAVLENAITELTGDRVDEAILGAGRVLSNVMAATKEAIAEDQGRLECIMRMTTDQLRRYKGPVVMMWVERALTLVGPQPKIDEAPSCQTYPDLYAWMTPIAGDISTLMSFSSQVRYGGFGKQGQSLFERYKRHIENAQQKKDEEQYQVYVDALTLLAAADGRVGSTETQAIASTLATFGVAMSDARLKALIKQAVAELQAKGATLFANTVRDRLAPYRGTKFCNDLLQAMVGLSERDGAVHEKETRVINWFKQQLVDGEAAQREASTQTEGEALAANAAAGASTSLPASTSGGAIGALATRQKAEAKAAAELKALADAHASGILDAAEYAAKTKLLRARIEEYEIAFAIEERSLKLRDAFDNGVISQEEYAAKLAAVKTAVSAEVKTAGKTAAKEAQIAKLQAAKDAGVLTTEEYEKKVAALG